MKVLILGGDGMLAYAIKQVFSFTNVISTNRLTCDITNPHQVESYIEKEQPNFVINCAAYTDVDNAEINKDICELVNSTAVEAIAQICYKNKITFVHFSTEMVFGQESPSCYAEYDEPLNPMNVYGKSKLKAEQCIKQTCEKYYIVRTSWMFGPNGNNFIDKILIRGKQNKSVEVISNQYGCPTYTFDLARALYDILAERAPFGIYHLINEGITTRANFAYEIFDYANIDCKVNQVSSTSILSLAQRPSNCVLLNTKRKKLPKWQDAMVEYLIGKGLIASF